MRARVTTTVLILVLPLLLFGTALGGEGVAGNTDSVKVHADSSCSA